MNGSRSSGFTLIEAIVALVIVAVVMTAALRLFTLQAAANDRAARDLAMAWMARDLVVQERVLGASASGREEGRSAGFSWSIDRRPAGTADRDAGWRLLDVTATVTHPRGVRHVLRSIRLVPDERAR